MCKDPDRINVREACNRLSALDSWTLVPCVFRMQECSCIPSSETQRSTISHWRDFGLYGHLLERSGKKGGEIHFTLISKGMIRVGEKGQRQRRQRASKLEHSLSTGWFMPQMAATARTELSRNQETGIPLQSTSLVAGIQVLKHLLPYQMLSMSFYILCNRFNERKLKYYF